LLQVGGIQVGIERVAVAVLVLVEDFLEVMVRNPSTTSAYMVIKRR
jgi:hypothetical protein